MKMILKVFHWIDGPPTMYIDSGWYWRLEDAKGKVRAESPWEGFKTSAQAEVAARSVFPDVELINLGKFNPDDPKEYIDGKYAGAF